MNFDESMQALEDEGFLWHRLRDYFPFGAQELREGNYQRLVSACLERLKGVRERSLLLDLVDLQAAAFLEQCWVQGEMARVGGDVDSSDDPDDVGRFGMAAHFAAAWLQINSNLRDRTCHPRRNLMSVLRGLEDGETLSGMLTKVQRQAGGVG